MSASPVSSRIQRLNQISTEIEKVERKYMSYLLLVSSLDHEIRERIELTADVAQSQLEIIRQLKHQAPPRDFSAVPHQIQEKMNIIRSQYLENYRNILNARDAIVEKGTRVALTSAKKQELTTRFTAELDQKINEQIKGFTLTSHSNLVSLELQTEEKIHWTTSLHAQMLDKKTKAAEKMFELKETPEFQDLLNEKQRLRNNLDSQDIWEAAEFGNVEYLEKAVKNHSWFQSKSWLYPSRSLLEEKNSQGQTLLHLACQNGHLHIVNFLLGYGVQASTPNQEKEHPIHLAARFGHVFIVERLLEYGVEVNARGAYGRTPLHIAVYNLRPLTVNLLLDKGADINAKASNDQNKTPLHEAVIHGNSQMVMQLTERDSLNVQMKDAQGHTPLYYAVEDGLVEIATLLTGHESWINNQFGPSDSNRTQNLLRLKIRYNQEAIRNFLERLPQ
jgi:ankyrin repeat protein